VLISRQSSTPFSDKEQIWADNASSSPFFGATYVCWAAFVGQEKGNAAPAPLQVAVSHDGIARHRHKLEGLLPGRRDGAHPEHVRVALAIGADRGATWSRPTPVTGPVTQPGVIDPVQGRPVIDGVAGARSDLAPAPSVDIANGAPTGADATNRIVMSYVSGTWRHRTSTSPSPPTEAHRGRHNERSRRQAIGVCSSVVFGS